MNECYKAVPRGGVAGGTQESKLERKQDQETHKLPHYVATRTHKQEAGHACHGQPIARSWLHEIVPH